MPVVERMQRAHAPHPGAGQNPLWLGAARLGRETMPVGRVADGLCSAVLLCVDSLVILLVLVLVGLIWRQDRPSSADFASLCCVFMASFIAVFLVRSHYDQRVVASSQVGDTLGATACAVGLSGASAFFLGLDVPRMALPAAGLVLLVLIPFARELSRAALSSVGLWHIPVVVIAASGFEAISERALFSHWRLGYTVMAVRDGLDRGETWADLLRTCRARLFIVANGADLGTLPGVIPDMAKQGVPYSVLSGGMDLPANGFTQAICGGDFVITSHRSNTRRALERACKVVFDLGMAAAALLALAPLMLVIAAIVAADGGPVLFAHSRVGAQGRIFQCLKFRSMVVDSEAALRQLFIADPAALIEWEQTHKLRYDPRVTWLGRFLRKTSLDELPQLLNVLRLEMSLVGPRPIVSLEIPKYGESISYYYETRPGITGLWQVSGRSNTTYEQRVQLDSWYVKNWSFWRDIVIMLRTVPAVLTGRGAG